MEIVEARVTKGLGIGWSSEGLKSSGEGGDFTVGGDRAVRLILLKCLTPLTLDILAIPLDGLGEPFPETDAADRIQLFSGIRDVCLRVLDIT